MLRSAACLALLLVLLTWIPGANAAPEAETEPQNEAPVIAPGRAPPSCATQFDANNCLAPLRLAFAASTTGAPVSYALTAGSAVLAMLVCVGGLQIVLAPRGACKTPFAL